ncbi:unnamed protein product [Durusdinium trenchii]|uniref:SH3 domain-containing protein n=1 Tax=Durusdinium trenchii TaxID=1381693 RepID=A0ABP0MQY5_9DINO
MLPCSRRGSDGHDACLLPESQRDVYQALSGLDHLYRPGLSGKDESCPIDEQELGQWHYLVTDPKGIQPRQEPMYSSKDPAKPKRPMGAVLEISLRRRSGWTRWLQVGEEEWLFDISPKDRKVRMVEVELQKGSWDFEVSVAELKLYPIPGAKNSSGTMKLGETFTADEKVRPRRSRGAFLHVAGTEHWVCDFLAGQQQLRRLDAKEPDEEGLSPLVIHTVVDERPEEEEVEVGEWKYIVLDPKGVTLRSHPTYDKAAKLKDRLEEGEIVEILERRAGAETVFLRVETTEGTRGWAFTTQPGPGSFLRLLEVEVKSCNLYFQVLKRSHLRRRCSFAEAAKVGRTVEKGQLLHVIRRLEVGGTTCLQIDSGEWLVCPKDQGAFVDGPLEVRKMHNEEAEVRAADAVALRKGPTELPWALTKKVLLPGSKVLAIRRAHLHGEMWMEVMQLGGLSGWMLASDLQLDFSISSLPRRNR